MLIDQINYDFVKIGEFLKKIKNLHKSYVTIPTRPPSFPLVHPAGEALLTEGYQVLSEILDPDKVELMLDYEGSDFYFSGNIEKDILSITSIHPIREKTLKEILVKKFNCNWDIVENLIKEKKLLRIPYNREIFYLRKMDTKQVQLKYN